MTLRSLTLLELSQFTGTVFRDRYRLTRLISSGANGAVYEAADLRFEGSRVAIKLAHSVNSELEFEKEAKLLRQLDRQPGVVGVSDYGVQDGIPFIVMEYLEGQSLFDLLKRCNYKLPADLVSKFVDEVGAALRGAHSKNVIHRDLKPQNVLLVDTNVVDDNGQIVQRFVLVDFGIASKIDATATMLNRTMAGLGTPEYRSPEQIKAKDDSPATDIYTFGVVLFELLTGRVPFPARTGSHADLGRLFIAIEEQPPPAPSEVAPDREIDPQIEKLVLECLEKEPAKRPQTIGEVRRRYLEIAAPSRRPGDMAVPYIGTLQPGGLRPSHRDTVVNTAGSTRTRWKTIVPSVFGWGPAAVLVVIAMGLVGTLIYKVVAPPAAWNPDPAIFETRGAAVVHVAFGGRPYKLAPRLVRKVHGLPAGEEVVFVLVRRQQAHGNRNDYFYLLRDKVWYDLYTAFVEEARTDPKRAGLDECHLSLDDVEHPLKEREQSFPVDSSHTDERSKWPVTNISPNVAYCFCRWLAPQGRLPSLTEWWIAAGYYSPKKDRKGPFKGNGENVAVNRKAPAPVGTQADDTNSEPFGCNDLAGNGYEWTCTSEIGTNCLADIKTSDVVNFPLKSRENALIRVGQKFDETEPLRFPDCPDIPDRQPNGAYSDIGFRVLFDPADSP